MKSAKVTSILLFATIALAPAIVRAQDLQIKGDSSQIFSAENNSTAASDKIAVSGRSTPQPYWGIGGSFQGGYKGLDVRADLSGANSRYGATITGANGTVNYGVYASAYGPSGSTNYAGYFSGNVYVQGTVTQSSDERLKLNIKDLGSSLDKILRLKPKTYSFKHDLAQYRALPEGTRHGFLAQELREVLPDLVSDVPAPSQKQDAKDTVVDGSTLSVNYIELIPILVKAVQEQQAQIEQLKARVARLEAR